MMGYNTQFIYYALITSNSLRWQMSIIHNLIDIVALRRQIIAMTDSHTLPSLYQTDYLIMTVYRAGDARPL